MIQDVWTIIARFLDHARLIGVICLLGEASSGGLHTRVSGMCGRKALCLSPGNHNEAMYLTRFPSLPCRIILHCPVMWAFTPACLPRVKQSKTTYQHTHTRRSHDVKTATTCERVNLPIHFSIRRKAVAVHALLPLCKDLGNLLREKDSSRVCRPDPRRVVSPLQATGQRTWPGALPLGMHCCRWCCCPIAARCCCSTWP